MKKLCLFLTAAALFIAAIAFASQNPLEVPDGTGAQVRAGFNNALDSLNTLESGPSAPTTTEAYMLWADTTNNLLKQRDAANATWIVLGTLGAADLGLEPAIAAGTTSQYWRGDKTWQTLNLAALGYTVGTAANNLVQLNSSGQLPAVSGANLTNLPSTGGLTSLGTTTITAATLTTISGLSPGVRYKLILNLVQNTSAGAQYVQFNGDTGSNYEYTDLLNGSASNAGGVSYGYLTAPSYPPPAGTYTEMELIFQTVPGNSDKVHLTGIASNNYGSSELYLCNVGVLYSGSAALSSITIGTNAGTLTGTATLYTLN